MLDVMDKHDLAILRILQEDNRVVIEEIANLVGLSPAAVHRRIKRLRDAKVIEKNVALMAQDRLGLPLTIVIGVTFERERLDLIDQFKSEIRKAPQVQQCYSLTGATDFLLIVIMKDLVEFEQFTNRLLSSNPNVRRFESSVVTQRIKTGLTLPI